MCETILAIRRLIARSDCENGFTHLSECNSLLGRFKIYVGIHISREIYSSIPFSRLQLPASFSFNREWNSNCVAVLSNLLDVHTCPCAGVLQKPAYLCTSSQSLLWALLCPGIQRRNKYILISESVHSRIFVAQIVRYIIISVDDETLS